MMEVKGTGWLVNMTKEGGSFWKIKAFYDNDRDYAFVSYSGDDFLIAFNKEECKMLLEFLPKIMEARGWK